MDARPTGRGGTQSLTKTATRAVREHSARRPAERSCKSKLPPSKAAESYRKEPLCTNTQRNTAVVSVTSCSRKATTCAAGSKSNARAASVWRSLTIKNAASIYTEMLMQYGKNGYKYRPQYGVIVRCKDEAHQQALYKQLTALGLKVKVVCV